MELSSRLELPNLFLTKEVLYLLSYDSMSRTLFFGTDSIIPLFFEICKYFLFNSLQSIINGFWRSLQDLRDLLVIVSFEFF